MTERLRVQKQQHYRLSVSATANYVRSDVPFEGLKDSQQKLYPRVMFSTSLISQISSTHKKAHSDRWKVLPPTWQLGEAIGR